MNPKKLTQAVFEGLPSEYRWAAVDGNGELFGYANKDPVKGFDRWQTAEQCRFIGSGYDATDWQNSLIERQDVLTADIDWSRQDVPEGATHLMRHPTALSFYRSGDDGWEGYHSKKREWYFLQNIDEFFHKNLLEIPLKPEPQVDWSKAPDGATHWHRGDFVRWTGKRNPVFGSWDMDGWLGGDWSLAHWGWQGTLETFLADGAIQRPESITDVARSIEAARVAEKLSAAGLQKTQSYPCRCLIVPVDERVDMPFPDGDPRYFETSDVPETKKYPHYFKDVSAVDRIDVYAVLRLFEVTDPCLQHIVKKALCAGRRGLKSFEDDVIEIYETASRLVDLERGK